MSKPAPIQLTIPHPCTQSWDEMTPAQQGRFCAHCQKTVIDFSSWSDTALYNFFAKNTDQVCGRLLSTQLDRKINIPYQPYSRLYRIAIALGLTLMFTQTPQLLAQNRPPKTEQTSVLKHKDPKHNYSGELGGRVLDDKKNPTTSVVVRVYCNEVLYGENTTDDDGNYSVRNLPAGLYDVKVKQPGFREIIVTGVVVKESRTTQNFALHRPTNSDTTTIITAYKIPLIDGNVRPSHILTREEIIQVPTQK